MNDPLFINGTDNNNNSDSVHLSDSTDSTINSNEDSSKENDVIFEEMESTKKLNKSNNQEPSNKSNIIGKQALAPSKMSINISDDDDDDDDENDEFRFCYKKNTQNTAQKENMKLNQKNQNSIGSNLYTNGIIDLEERKGY
jgi:hypothetical protein